VTRGSTLRRPREHWWTLGALLLVLACVLLLQGYARADVGRAGTASADRSAPVPEMKRVGPVLDLSGTVLRSVTPPARTIALTFDDGPDPRWTRAIHAVLDRYGVPATFFVVGSHAAEHPHLVRLDVREGNEVGNHTFTHADLTRLPAWRMRLELRLTETAVAAATGHYTTLVRPPYSSVPSAAATDTLGAWQRVARQGYLIVTATLDSGDWRPNSSVNDILARSTPSGSEGAILLMHDGGGNRARTVAALEELIPLLKARGDRFVTIGQLAHLDRSSVMPPASALDRWQSQALPVTLSIGERIAGAFAAVAVALMALVLARLVLVLTCARRHPRRLVDLDPNFTPAVTILVPAYNEQVGIEATVRSLCSQRYPHYEVVVIDDGSTDATAAIVEHLAAELPSLTMLRQPNSGKADALNAGLRVAAGDVIVTVDGDTVFEQDALARLIQPLRDPEVGAVSGNTKVANRHRLLGRWQHFEYVMGFNLDRRMYDVLGCMPTVPGAIGAFQAAALDRVSGFSSDTLAEDTDLTMTLHRAGYQVVYEPRAVAWTEAPETLRDLWRQRYRWSYGTIQSVWKHRRATIEGGPSTRLGRIGLPYLGLFQIVLPLLAPVVDLFALYGLVFLDTRAVIAYWLTFTGLQTATMLYALRLDNDSPKGLWTLPLQQIVYRQTMYLVVIQAATTAITGTRTTWHKLRRTGVAAHTQNTAPLHSHSK
jgi:poly-beta-1,6 N-acetyl-D-glucosamine synthase